MLTKEQRIELLKLAREAKAKKKIERDGAKPVVKRGRKKKEDISVKEDINPEPVVEEPVVEEPVVEEPVVEDPVKKPKPKKIKDPVNTLTLEMPDDQPDIIYETEIRKKPKKKIIKKIIYEDDSDDEIEEVIVDNRKKKTVKEVKKPVKLNENKNENIITEPEPVKEKVCPFNFFNC
jgi:hypothetical protein